MYDQWIQVHIEKSPVKIMKLCPPLHRASLLIECPAVPTWFRTLSLHVFIPNPLTLPLPSPSPPTECHYWLSALQCPHDLEHCRCMYSFLIPSHSPSSSHSGQRASWSVQHPSWSSIPSQHKPQESRHFIYKRKFLLQVFFCNIACLKVQN